MIKKNAAFIILIVVILSVFPNIIKPARCSSFQGKFLGAKFYFHRELSGLDNFRNLNTSFPTLNDNNNISRNLPSGIFEVGSGWITQGVPLDITLERSYNFLFSVWARGTGTAQIFFGFYGYRNGNTRFFFNSSQSEVIPLSAMEMLWQHKTKNVILDIEKGDRLILKCYINVSSAGRFGVGYDCKSYPSYVEDPAETRYMRSDKTVTTYTVNYATVNIGTLSSGSISDTYTSNNVYAVFTSASSGGTNIIDVDWVQEHPTAKAPVIVLTFEMKGSSTAPAVYVAMYNYDLGRFAIAGETGYWSGALSLTDTTNTISIYVVCDHFFDYNTEIKFKLRATYATTSFTISVDWLKWDFGTFKLGTSQTSSSLARSILLYSKLGIRVWKISSTSVETEITSGTPVAQVTVPSEDGEVDGTYSQSAYTLAAGDSIVIRIYKYLSPNWVLLSDCVFNTEDLSGSLTAATWTVHYYFLVYFEEPPFYSYFEFGSSTWNSRITNFSYGANVVDLSLSLTVKVQSSKSAQVTFNPSSSFTVKFQPSTSPTAIFNVSPDLTIKMALSETCQVTFNFSPSLSIKLEMPSPVAQVVFNVVSDFTAKLNLLLNATAIISGIWNTIETWTFSMTTLFWQSISTWTFTLVTEIREIILLVIPALLFTIFYEVKRRKGNGIWSSFIASLLWIAISLLWLVQNPTLYAVSLIFSALGIFYIARGIIDILYNMRAKRLGADSIGSDVTI